MGIAVEKREDKLFAIKTVTVRGKDFSAVEVLDEGSAIEIDKSAYLQKKEILQRELEEVNLVLEEINKAEAKL